MSLNLGSLGMEDASFNFGGSYIMALDCGTTSVLATIVDEYGCIVAQARRSVKTSFPRPGWIEQDPMEVLASQIGVMMEVQFKSGIHSDRIAAIGISNQRETTVVWDRISGQPIYNAIVWQCRRTAPLIDELVERGAEELVRSLGPSFPTCPPSAASKTLRAGVMQSGARSAPHSRAAMGCSIQQTVKLMHGARQQHRHAPCQQGHLPAATKGAINP